MNKFVKKFREPVNGLTHLFGAVFSVIGLALLLYDAILSGKTLQIIAFSIFGFSMVALYASSSLYHSLNVSDKAILWLRKLDHSMIYVLIAGTYTPILLLVFNGEWRWELFTSIWGLSAAGILMKVFWFHELKYISTAFYLFMGWLSVIILPTLFEILPVGFLIWIGIGGLAYTIGFVIFGLKKPDPYPEVFGHHEIWHLFVLAGTFAHFMAIYEYLAG